MKIKEIEFIGSFPKEEKMPQDLLPEFAFIGRSNVGKSSLINMLCNNEKLAKVSSTPGKTQLINVFMINKRLKVIDLPGFGYAKVSQKLRKSCGQMIEHYLINRSNLTCVFVLIDSRLEPQKIDAEFIAWCGEHNLPLALIYTKSDKSKLNTINQNIQKMRNILQPIFQNLPDTLLTSAEKKTGKEEVWDYIEKVLVAFEKFIHENKIK
jgi:GTP-binding protein